MADITDSLSEPYSLSTALLPSGFSSNVVGVAGRPFLIDSTGGKYNRRAVVVLQQRNTSDQRDILLLPQDIWRQSIESWHFGAGQSNQDRNESLPYRFNNSFGVDPWNRYELTLLNETERLGTATYSGKVWLTLHEGGLLVVANDDSIYTYDTLSASATPTATITPSAGNPILDMSDDGHIITTVHQDGKIYKIVPGVTPTVFKTLTNANVISWEKDYLIVGHANVLKDATGSGNPATIYTHPDSVFRWVDFASGRSCIYALGGIGDRFVVHRVMIQEDGTAFKTAIVAAQLPDGEIGYSIHEYLGFIFIGTSKGVRMALMEDDASLTLGPIIPTPHPVYCFEGEDRFVWFGMRDIDPNYTPIDDEEFPAGPVCGLGRLDLSTFTISAVTPAYATDIFTTAETGKDVHAVLTYQGKRVFAVNDGAVYFEKDTKVPYGYLTQGKFSFSVEDLKSALYQQVKWIPGCAGLVNLDLAFDSTGFSRFHRLQISPSLNRSDNLSLNGIPFSLFEARFVIGRCPINTSTAPRVTRWEFRASPIKGRASRWEVPIMLYEEIEIDGVKYVRNVNEEVQFLVNLIETGKVFTYQESGRSYQVHARDFVWQPEKLSATYNGWQGTFTLVIEEVR
jgi:hypothetical protein